MLCTSYGRNVIVIGYQTVRGISGEYLAWIAQTEGYKHIAVASAQLQAIYAWTFILAQMYGQLLMQMTS